ncbi:MAG: RNA polymerase sigma factor [Actinomycetes bacterium]
MSDVDDWVIAARSGGGWAFERLWLEFAGPVAGYLRSRGVHSVDDVASEVFLAAFQRLPSFEGDGQAFRSWLFTIAHHRSVDDRRREARERRTTVTRLNLDTAASAEDEAFAGVQIRAWLDSLPHSQRDVIWLRFVVDLSLEDVAKVTGQSVGAVKALQRRGIQRLQRHLNGATLREPASPASLLTIAEQR